MKMTSGNPFKAFSPVINFPSTFQAEANSKTSIRVGGLPAFEEISFQAFGMYKERASST